MQFVKVNTNIRDIVDWSSSKVVFNKEKNAMEMDTGNGIGYAYVNDYIIQDVKGTFYPCPNSQFSLLYNIIERI